MSTMSAVLPAPLPARLDPWAWSIDRLSLPPINHFDFPQSQSMTLPPPRTLIQPADPIPQLQQLQQLPQPAQSIPIPTPRHISLPHNQPSTSTLPPPSANWYGPETAIPVVAEKTAEMVCYLWFSSRDSSTGSPQRARSRTRHSPKLDPAQAALQFAPSSQFTDFVRRILETTQVSQSVIILSLHYINKLRTKNDTSPAAQGSEFRVAVVSLMLANKFLDDNTYTNKTWSEVSGIELEELNQMEREFLCGIDSALYVNKGTYDSWLQLLKGMVLAKERERAQWQLQAQSLVRHPDCVRYAPVPRHPLNFNPGLYTPSRPRSSSPPTSSKPYFPFTFNVRAPRSFHLDDVMQTEASSNAGYKRSADSAFEDNIARPAKRTITLQTEGVSGFGGPRSAGPSFASAGSNTPNHEAFARLTISSTRPSYRSDHLQPSNSYVPSTFTPSRPVEPQTLAQPYSIDQQQYYSQPQNLYFYALSGSPLESVYGGTDHRKAKLRYAPLQSPVLSAQQYPSFPPFPLSIQSAHASPRDRVDLSVQAASNYFTNSVTSRLLSPPTNKPQGTSNPSGAPPPSLANGNPVPLAHFANAGPSGLFWASDTPIAQSQDISRNALFSYGRF